MTATDDTPPVNRSRGNRGGVQYRAKRALWIANGGKHARPVPTRENSNVMRDALLRARVSVDAVESPVVATVLAVLRSAI